MTFNEGKLRRFFEGLSPVSPGQSEFDEMARLARELLQAPEQEHVETQEEPDVVLNTDEIAVLRKLGAALLKLEPEEIQRIEEHRGGEVPKPRGGLINNRWMLKMMQLANNGISSLLNLAERNAPVKNKWFRDTVRVARYVINTLKPDHPILRELPK